MANKYRTIWTKEAVYATIKAFVVAEGRLPSVRDYEARTHGLPSNSGIAYRVCKDYKALLAHDGIAYRATPKHGAGDHPWRRATALLVAHAQQRSAVHAHTPID